MKRIKKGIWIMPVLALLIVCAGCGSGKNSSNTVSMYDLRTAMEQADPDLPEMLNASSTEKDAEDKFSHISDMDYKKVDSYFVSYSSDGHKADEIVVIAVKDKADVDEAKESLTKHQQDRYNLLQSYEPKQVSRIQDGLIFTEGQYAVLIITNHNDDVRKAFEDTIKSE
ncbi:MAG: DUF4358 domain-containing protein [Agathobacter sp.]|jgi:hypothetical protein|nr:DUF4358 domain-containing protein [Agathobacter sp.]MDY6362238.1 DUF4358 domain-containing protein [Lachnospiraceae bacterium]